MKKYNKAEIMRRAWEIRRQDDRYLFGLCLKMAWDEAKGIIKKMTGSKKQIAWAEDIKRDAIQTIEANLRTLRRGNVPFTYEKNLIKAYETILEGINKLFEMKTYAGDIIAKRRLLHPTMINKQADIMARKAA